MVLNSPVFLVFYSKFEGYVIIVKILDGNSSANSYRM